MVGEHAFKSVAGFQVGQKVVVVPYKREKISLLRDGSGHTAQLGQLVRANGHFGPPAGTRGIVIHLDEPYTHSFTDDVIRVWFEGEEHYRQMKFKDLVPSVNPLRRK